MPKKTTSAKKLDAQVEELQKQVKQLQEDVRLGAYLHTELAFQAGLAVATLVWLHDEKGFFLNEFIDSENRLIARARQVKAAKAAQAQAQMGLPTP